MAEQQKYDPRSVVREKYPALSVAKRNEQLLKSYKQPAQALFGLGKVCNTPDSGWGLMNYSKRPDSGVKEGEVGMPSRTTDNNYRAPFYEGEIPFRVFTADDIDYGELDRTRNGRLPRLERVKGKAITKLDEAAV